MGQFIRRIIGFGVHAGDVDGVSLCCMFNKAVSAQGAPHYISSDPLFLYHQWQANLRILGANEIKTIPYTPLSHPFAERLIGTIRQEFLDQTLFWNEVDLQRKLETFQDYYNHSRFHSSLDGDAPAQVDAKARTTIANLESYCWRTHCGGLVQLPMAA